MRFNVLLWILLLFTVVKKPRPVASSFKTKCLLGNFCGCPVGCPMVKKNNITALQISYYFLTERPKVTHVNPKYLSFVNLTATRRNRRSPIYYVDLHYTQLVYADDSVKVDFYFYQFLSNQYQRSFVEMHFTVCNLVHNDKFFGAALKQGMLAQPCPYPPGDYHMYNMSIPSAIIPPGFPFEKGRIYANLTHEGVDVAGGYIDMELKEKRTRERA